jgi:hypothetical protein
MAFEDILGPLTELGGTGADYYLNLGINIILSTLIGGIVILILVSVLGKGWGVSIKPANAFFMILIINIINTFGIIGLLYGYVSVVPLLPLILPLLIWIVFMKLFFAMGWKHAAIAGIIGYVVSILLIPYLIAYARGFIPV